MLLALLGMAALRVWPGERWTVCGAMLGLLGALAWLPGFEWPAPSRTLKLPWVVMAGLGLALLATAREAGSARPVWTLLSAVAAWGGAVLWLAGGQANLPLLVGAWLLGAAVLGLMAGGQGRAASSATAAAAAAVAVAGLAGQAALAGYAVLTPLAVLAVAAMGLAALAATGGSLLLAQLAGMLASTAVAMAGWVWLRPSARMAVARVGCWPLVLAWLSIAFSWVLAAPAPGGLLRALQVALLALAFLLPTLLSRWPAAALAPRWRPWAVALAVTLAAMLLAALAVGLGWWVGTAGPPMPDTAIDPDDPYLPSSRP